MSNKTNSKIRPLQDRLIVERIEGEEKTAGGLYIPDSAKEKPQQGRVLAVGKGKVEFDKREDLKRRESDREMKQATMRRTKGKSD